MPIWKAVTASLWGSDPCLSPAGIIAVRVPAAAAAAALGRT